MLERSFLLNSLGVISRHQFFTGTLIIRMMPSAPPPDAMSHRRVLKKMHSSSRQETMMSQKFIISYERLILAGGDSFLGASLFFVLNPLKAPFVYESEKRMCESLSAGVRASFCVHRQPVV